LHEKVGAGVPVTGVAPGGQRLMSAVADMVFVLPDRDLGTKQFRSRIGGRRFMRSL
jgi:hypothetical protein